MDDFIRKRLPEDVVGKIDKFEEKDAFRPKVPVVYGIYQRKADKCLYIGKTDNLFSRLDNHFHGGGNDFVDKLKDEPDPEINPDRVWYETEVKYVIISDSSVRNRVEDVLIEEYNPKYNLK